MILTYDSWSEGSEGWQFAGEEGAIRLTDSGNGDDPAAGVGVLEIFHAGAWGSVCAAEQDSPAFRVRPPNPFTEVCFQAMTIDGCPPVAVAMHVHVNVDCCDGENSNVWRQHSTLPWPLTIILIAWPSQADLVMVSVR